jgi:DNA invertase Pin-like site-specific DNA recombinase
MRTALYLRVSTEHQKPDLQADGMRRYAAQAKFIYPRQSRGFVYEPPKAVYALFEQLELI